MHVYKFSTPQKIQSRVVPIPTALSQAGVDPYLEFLKCHIEQRLLFDLPANTGRYREKVRKWFSG
ncbi:hypothetical protein [Pseudoalteromonas phenolica]|uniref:hypothetical protein n=1 Tax=Pseudoalteromonas phenolica TaxID=161398 RepID=UPI00110B446E|nr:hypothetical protein [Pseudoalteromonas phenolica]